MNYIEFGNGDAFRISIDNRDIAALQTMLNDCGNWNRSQTKFVPLNPDEYRLSYLSDTQGMILSFEYLRDYANRIPAMVEYAE